MTRHCAEICRRERELPRHPAGSLEALVLQAEIQDLRAREWQLARARVAATIILRVQLGRPACRFSHEEDS